MYLVPYRRRAAVQYAHMWAYGRNPQFYDYEELGGDCTNFASQCLYAGSGVMNFTPTFGWYYLNANEKAPAWTGVPYLWNFLTRTAESVGPVAVPCSLYELRPGDLVQLRFRGEEFQHTPVVVLLESLGAWRRSWWQPTVWMRMIAHCPVIRSRSCAVFISWGYAALERQEFIYCSHIAFLCYAIMKLLQKKGMII